jgi:hypothetical protein
MGLKPPLVEMTHDTLGVDVGQFVLELVGDLVGDVTILSALVDVADTVLELEQLDLDVDLEWVVLIVHRVLLVR